MAQSERRCSVFTAVVFMSVSYVLFIVSSTIRLGPSLKNASLVQWKLKAVAVSNQAAHMCQL